MTIYNASGQDLGPWAQGSSLPPVDARNATHWTCPFPGLRRCRKASDIADLGSEPECTTSSHTGNISVSVQSARGGGE